MSAKWLTLALATALTLTLLNAIVLIGQLSAPASARTAPTSASKLLDDDDFTDGLTKLIRKTVRSYCTVGKRESIDC